MRVAARIMGSLAEHGEKQLGGHELAARARDKKAAGFDHFHTAQVQLLVAAIGVIERFAAFGEGGRVADDKAELLLLVGPRFGKVEDVFTDGGDSVFHAVERGVAANEGKRLLGDVDGGDVRCAVERGVDREAAGTAAEVTINYVITDEKNEKKMVCVDPNDIPAIAIIDAELMYTLPKSLTAATGLDALTHAIEGLITKGAWEMSDMFEIKAIEMINRYLETAVNEPQNPEARNGMAVAQYIAGMAFSNVGLGVVHGMAHPLGAIFDIPHGVANALLLPTIMEFNAPAALDKYVTIAKAMNVYKDGMSKEEAAQAAVDAVKSLAVRVGIPQHLSELGIKESDLPKLADSAIADVCTPGNPREVTRDIILDLYRKVL